MRNKISLLLVVASLACILAVGQERGPDSLTLQHRVDLITVPVHVTGGGRHVSGLRADDFTLYQDGVPQKIAHFEEFRSSPLLPRAQEYGDKEFGNVLSSGPPARVTVVAIDQVNSTAMDMSRLRSGLRKFLAENNSDAPIAVVAIRPSGIRVIHDFAIDRREILVALDRNQTASGHIRSDSSWLDETLDLVPSGRQSELPTERHSSDAGILAFDQAALQFRERTARLSSLSALQQIATALSGMPGHKSLVWISAGYPFASLFRASRESTTAVVFTPGNALEATGLDEYTAQLLNSANIAVYPVDARGMTNDAWSYMDPGTQRATRLSEAERLRNSEVITTFERLASSTGGKACFGAEVASCIKTAVDDAEQYYLLGYYASRTRLLPGWHKLTVKLAGKYSVRSRTGFLVASTSVPAWNKKEMADALHSNLSDRRIPFRGQWKQLESDGVNSTVEISLWAPAWAVISEEQTERLNLDIAVFAWTKAGRVAGQFAEHIERELNSDDLSKLQSAGLQYRNKLKLPTGEFLLRVAIRENQSGRMGSTSATILTQSAEP